MDVYIPASIPFWRTAPSRILESKLGFIQCELDHPCSSVQLRHQEEYMQFFGYTLRFLLVSFSALVWATTAQAGSDKIAFPKN